MEDPTMLAMCAEKLKCSPTLSRVPVIVFISAPSAEDRAYDVRFWKIAFGVPDPDRILGVMGDSGDQWQSLGVWNSILSPSGSL
ncbi:hypothetical protein CBS101457_004445 [Exobasidium rhododendri]|nr:hypothetical protein CBS101457_004445 [Exobasidium rhododendri]